jgi:hypothetical protein
MSEYRGRLDPLRGSAEKMAIVRRRGAPLHLQGVAVVRRDTPAVGVLEPAQIAPALTSREFGAPTRCHSTLVGLFARRP